MTMLKANQATKRLQATWDALYPDESRVIKKVIATPRSSGSVGWTWAAIAPDGVWTDLGYTEQDASSYIRQWNSPMLKASRNLDAAMNNLLNSIQSFTGGPNPAQGNNKVNRPGPIGSTRNGNSIGNGKSKGKPGKGGGNRTRSGRVTK